MLFFLLLFRYSIRIAQHVYRLDKLYRSYRPLASIDAIICLQYVSPADARYRPLSPVVPH
jgi:hypothetical protein